MSEGTRLVLRNGLVVEEVKQHSNDLGISVPCLVCDNTDAVSRTQMVRSKVIVRIFRLAGTAPLPVTYEFESDVL